ncbi:hypothetical protein ALC60_07667 [Trachymyrmex zeteki]|uniref:Uncharacterized protein n=1 Tax=Mycetomoellerius zeteki TaxID=64791 RepID=A0A151WZ13_9HYME|nr:hypothetical protein ALC60_07667 [Trachymyrmex zeteki]
MRNAIPTVKRWVEAVNLAVTKVAQACPACSGCQAVAETRTVSVAHPDHVYHFRLPASISTSSELGLTARSFIPRNVKQRVSDFQTQRINVPSIPVRIDTHDSGSINNQSVTIMLGESAESSRQKHRTTAGWLADGDSCQQRVQFYVSRA